jgi:RNA polymerase sigma factor (sigma-70 family)
MDPALWKDLRTLYHFGTIGDLTDGQLLERFVEGAGGVAEASFAALVERHGPMVLRICRQVLGDDHDAQDALQATFLVLVRRAGAVRRRDSVASWLFGVALRVARKARAGAARRRAHELRTAARAAETAIDEAPPEPECWAELHEEIDRLPEKYRSAVVLCYLEGLTTGAAARRLGCPQGTVLSRLSRAREQLRTHLTRRGLAVPAGLWVAGSGPIGAAAPVPTALIEATGRAAMELAAGRAWAGTVPASVAALTATITRGLLMAKLNKTASVLVALGLVSAGVAGLARQEAGREKGGEPSRPGAGAGSASRDDAQRIQGTWVMIAQETNGQEVAPDQGVKLVITADTMITVYPKGDRREAEDAKNGTDRASYKIDSAREPKTIDFTPVDGIQKGKTRSGIYRIDGDTLQICTDPSGGSRPTEFDTTPGSHHRLMILRRETPIQLQASPAPAAAGAGGAAAPPMLEFRIVADAAHDRAAVEKAKAPDGLKNPPAGYRWAALDDRFIAVRFAEGELVREGDGPDGKPHKYVLIKLDPQNLTEKGLAEVKVDNDPRNLPAVFLRFSPDGSRRLGELTRTHLPEDTAAGNTFKYKLAIILDGAVVATPVINTEVRDAAMIEFAGVLQAEEFRDIAARLDAAKGDPTAGK